LSCESPFGLSAPKNAEKSSGPDVYEERVDPERGAARRAVEDEGGIGVASFASFASVVLPVLDPLGNPVGKDYGLPAANRAGGQGAGGLVFRDDQALRGRD